MVEPTALCRITGSEATSHSAATVWYANNSVEHSPNSATTGTAREFGFVCGSVMLHPCLINCSLLRTHRHKNNLREPKMKWVPVGYLTHKLRAGYCIFSLLVVLLAFLHNDVLASV